MFVGERILKPTSADLCRSMGVHIRRKYVNLDFLSRHQAVWPCLNNPGSPVRTYLWRCLCTLLQRHFFNLMKEQHMHTGSVQTCQSSYNTKAAVLTCCHSKNLKKCIKSNKNIMFIEAHYRLKPWNWNVSVVTKAASRWRVSDTQVCRFGVESGVLCTAGWIECSID